ncbi:MAG: hypothetical protein R2769_11050 [Saprospiraceae bacterium]
MYLLDPTNPWGFPEVENFNDIAGDQLSNFIAIKVGDISGDANPALTGIQNRSYQRNLLL